MNKEIGQFRDWDDKKIKLHLDGPRVFFHEREIWSTSLGINIGFEQDGKGSNYLRPVLIVKKFNNDIFWCIPLSKSRKSGKYYHMFNFNGDISNAILSQIRLIDSKRLRYKIGDINYLDFCYIKEKLRQFLA